MEQVIAKMRADYQVLARWLLEEEGWTEEQVGEMGETIRQDVESGDADRIGLWAEWLVERHMVAREVAYAGDVTSTVRADGYRIDRFVATREVQGAHAAYRAYAPDGCFLGVCGGVIEQAEALCYEHARLRGAA